MAFIYQTHVNCLRLCVCFFSVEVDGLKREEHTNEKVAVIT